MNLLPWVVVIESSPLGPPDYWDGLRAVWRRRPDRDAVSVRIIEPGIAMIDADDSRKDKHFRSCTSSPSILGDVLRVCARERQLITYDEADDAPHIEVLDSAPDVVDFRVGAKRFTIKGMS